MSAMHDIRTRVFRISQSEMARITGVHQSTVSRWERGADAPGLPEMARIRDEAARRGLTWDDRWFFLPPQQDGAAA